MLLCLLLSFPIFAENALVLVASPPVYKTGETATGELTTVEGGHAVLIQRVVDVPTYGQVIEVELVNLGGLVGVIHYDPKTWNVVLPEGSETTLNKTCLGAFYPIVKGKKVSCVLKYTKQGKQRTTSYTYAFDEVLYEKGKQRGFCAMVLAHSAEYMAKEKMCFTPDGKWIISIEGISMTRTI